jgi:hypothetical protein
LSTVPVDPLVIDGGTTPVPKRRTLTPARGQVVYEKDRRDGVAGDG